MPAGFLIWICAVSTDLRLKTIVLPYIMNELSECLIKITEKWDEVKIIYFSSLEIFGLSIILSQKN